VRIAGVRVARVRVARFRGAGPGLWVAGLAGALRAVVGPAWASWAAAAAGRAPYVARAVLALAGFPHGVYPGTVGTPGSVAGWL
jgi:hypothetical protein